MVTMLVTDSRSCGNESTAALAISLRSTRGHFRPDPGATEQNQNCKQFKSQGAVQGQVEFQLRDGSSSWS
jgi:hypothetical protein